MRTLDSLIEGTVERVAERNYIEISPQSDESGVEDDWPGRQLR